MSSLRPTRRAFRIDRLRPEFRDRPSRSRDPNPCSRPGTYFHPIFLKSQGTIQDAATQQILNTFPLNKQPIHTNQGYDFMRLDRIAMFLGSFLAAAAALTAAPAAAQSPYDGLWNVTVVTKTGSCEPSTRSTLTVADGRVSAAGAEVSGSIGREGLVRVSINGAYANGQLSGNTGSGKWNGASAGIPCSGRWEASRQ
jgi:hypothetical protein